MADPTSPLIEATVVHVSDLHFGRPYDDTLGLKLLEEIPPLKPHLIVVSGDLADNPRPRWFRAAARYLSTLQLRCYQASQRYPELLVVPGNHDRKLLGNLSLGLLARAAFEVYFQGYSCEPRSQKPPDRFEVPGWRERLRRYQAFFRNRVRIRLGKLFRDPLAYQPTLEGRVLAGGNLIVVPYDSNDAFFLASGRVRPQQIGETEAALQRLDSSPSPAALRIAVLHHHPVPIPYADTRKLTNTEAFLVLENGGTFMREMVRNGFDLVLHGHKHYSNFTRVSYQLSATERGEVGILAAGTATARDSHKNNYNVIHLYRRGQTEIQLWEYSPSQTKHHPAHAPQPFLLHDPSERKKRAWRRNLRQHQVKARCLTATKEVFDDGRSRLQLEVEGLSVETGSLHGYGFTCRSLTGLTWGPWLGKDMVQAGVTWHKDSPPPGPQASIEEKLLDAQKIHGHFQFNRPVARVDRPLDLRLRYSMVNGDALSDWEFDLLYEKRFQVTQDGHPLSAPVESFAQVVWYPLERLRLRVKLPPVIEERPHLDVFACQDLAGADIIQGNILQYPSLQNELWERDSTMAGLEQLRKETDNTWLLEVDYPPMGHCYSINWLLPQTAAPGNLSDLIAEARTFRQLLLRYRNERRSPDAPSLPHVQQVQAIFGRFYSMVRALFPCMDTREKMDVVLMTYDDDNDRRRLVVVEGVLNGQDLPSPDWDFWLPPGVGNAGACFKEGERAFVYLADQVSEEFNYYLTTGHHHQVLVSVPLDHPRFKPAPGHDPHQGDPARRRQLVGVMNVGSDCLASTLRRMQAQTSELEALKDLCQYVLNGIWAVLEKAQWR